MLHSKTKHIAIKYHMLREKVIEKEIRLEYVSTKEKIANIFIKSLPKETFEYLQGMLRVMPSIYIRVDDARVHRSSDTEHYGLSGLNVDASYMGEHL